MDNFLDNVMADINRLLFFRNMGNLNFGELFCWVVLSLIGIMVIFRVFRRDFILRIFFTFFAAVGFCIATHYLFGSTFEATMISYACVAFSLLYAAYIFLLWFPLWLQYDKKAELKIKELEQKHQLNDADIERLYRLKASTRSVYESNMRWLFKLDDRQDIRYD